jgi:hypothetical protein
MFAYVGKKARRTVAHGPWPRQITDSLDRGIGRSHVGDAEAYVRKGKRNNFDWRQERR